MERLLLQNDIFGDDIKLEGIGGDSDSAVVVTSQPNVTGGAVTAGEIVAFMQRHAFQLVPDLSLGNPGALAFYRDLDEVAVFDAHPANFVKDQNGVILPIDLIMVRADGALQAVLARCLA